MVSKQSKSKIYPIWNKFTIFLLFNEFFGAKKLKFSIQNFWRDFLKYYPKF
jgi:hypothetical protein